ncbi:MAG TPA: helix-turn-helix transcriptional regulator [Clostridia bacterium]|nr:helix-turn-helix transcriptional regulator [Clostridia bacterium]
MFDFRFSSPNTCNSASNVLIQHCTMLYIALSGITRFVARTGVNMSSTYEEIGRKIRTLRTGLNGIGISQEALAEGIGTNPNTISRWETAIYKPTLDDLEKLSKFFKMPISYFLPQSEIDSRSAAILNAIRDLSDNDAEDVIRYALFRRATAVKL